MDPAAQFMQATGTTDANQAASMLAAADGDVEVRYCVSLVPKPIPIFISTFLCSIAALIVDLVWYISILTHFA